MTFVQEPSGQFLDVDQTLVSRGGGDRLYNPIPLAADGALVIC